MRCDCERCERDRFEASVYFAGTALILPWVIAAWIWVAS